MRDSLWFKSTGIKTPYCYVLMNMNMWDLCGDQKGRTVQCQKPPGAEKRESVLRQSASVLPQDAPHVDIEHLFIHRGNSPAPQKGGRRGTSGSLGNHRGACSEGACLLKGRVFWRGVSSEGRVFWRGVSSEGRVFCQTFLCILGPMFGIN